MDNDGDSPPTFWFQPPIATRHRPPSPFLNPVALIIILPLLALLIFFFFFPPPFLNHTSHVLKPVSVKKSWDSLNIFLVLFAILCGILCRKNDDIPPDDDGDGGRDQVNPATQWGEYIDQDRKVCEPVNDNSRLRRISSSYPDLRQESLLDTGDNRLQFFDDFGVNLYSSSSVQGENVVYRLLPTTLPPSEVERAERTLFPPSEAETEFSEEKEIPVDTFQVHRYLLPPSPPQSPAPPPPPPPPPPPTVHSKRRQSYQSVKRKEKVEIESETEFEPLPPPPPAVHSKRRQSYQIESEAEHEPLPPPPPAVYSKQRQSYHSAERKEKLKIESEAELEIRPPAPPPPPPPPPATTSHRSQLKHKKLEQQISDATKEIATAITSLYNQSKRKKKHRTRNIYDNATLSPLSAHSSPEQAAVPPPTPPPLPPPPFVFHNMFKKGTKQKRIHSIAVTSPPPQSQLTPLLLPPPPPPPHSIFNTLFKGGGKSKRLNSSTAPMRPPPPPPPSVSNSNIKSRSITKRHSPAIYPPPAPLPPLSPPTLFTKCQSAESVQAYSNSPVVSPRLSRRKIQTQLPATPPLTEHIRQRPSNKGKPPLPTKSSNHYERDDYREYLNSGSQSPLYPIPPPLPPFQMPEMKFKVRGDFVSIRSAQSSVCNSPDRNDADFSSLVESDSGEVIGPVFFPSPDVNAKADSFISRLKDEWRLEKVKAKDGLRADGPRPIIKPAVNILY